MWQKIKDFINYASEKGLPVPMAREQPENRPSFTLLAVYLTFMLALGSAIALHFNQKLVISTMTAICFWVVAMVFYRIRNLKKAKIDLDDKSVELDSGEDSEPAEAKSEPAKRESED